METKFVRSDEAIEKIETLRKEVFHLENNGTYYKDKLLNKSLIAVATFDEDEMVAGVYFHFFNNTMVIDQLFVREDYQNRGLKLGRQLVLRLIYLKTQLEKMYGVTINACYIDSQNQKAHELYKKIGFRESNLDPDTMFRIL